MMRRKQDVPVPERCGMQQNQRAREAKSGSAATCSAPKYRSAEEGAEKTAAQMAKWQKDGSYLCVRCQNCSLGEV